VFILWNVVKVDQSRRISGYNKTYLSNTCRNSDQTTVLVVDDTVVSDQTTVTEVFNNCFVSVASDIESELGKQTDFSSHSSVQAIRCNARVDKTFHFYSVLPSTVSKSWLNLTVKSQLVLMVFLPRF